MRQTYNITPVPKPRMTQKDKWLNPARPCVQRYWDFVNQVSLNGVELPACRGSVLFILPMPKSWSMKKKKMLEGQPHQQRPDLSNCIKALEDAIYGEDSVIWQYRGLEKRWGYEGKIVIQVEERG